VLRLHKDEMQARSQLSTAPAFQLIDKFSVGTKCLFLRDELNPKLKDMHLGLFMVLDNIGANTYKLELSDIVYAYIRCFMLTIFFHTVNPCTHGMA
jgi:hypothetical protein